MVSEEQNMVGAIRDAKGKFIPGEALSHSKRTWWKNMSDEDKKSLLEKYSKNNGRPTLGLSGEKHPAFKGYRKLDKRDGYILIYCPEHPFSRKNSNGYGGYVLEHRLVMEKMVGRYLFPDEDVNHVNGIKDDNRPENLKLVRHNAHYEPHICPKCNFEWWTR